MYYFKWKKYLEPFMELYGVELAGRGRRIREPFCRTMEETVEDLSGQVLRRLEDGGSYAFFGHSMGCYIAFELACRLQETGKAGPVHVFCSGADAPEEAGEEFVVHTLPEKKFTDYVLGFHGMDRTVFEQEELCRVFLPILRADFQVIDQYDYGKTHGVLHTDITVLYGDQDHSIRSELSKWERFTDGSCHFIRFEGDHFYLTPHMREVVQTINRTLRPYER